MKEFSYVITDKEGIHARPAGLLVKAAGQFKSSISIQKGEKNGDLKRIFSVMGLAAKQGDSITVRVEGEDEDEAIATIEAFVTSNL